jgi:hypothetical protein
MDIPPWLIDVIRNSSWLLVPLGIIWAILKLINKISSPLFIATIISVLGTKAMRDDAYRTVKTLCDRDNDQSPIEASPASPPGAARLRRRRRRR